MSLPVKLYRFKIEFSDIEKSNYQSLDFRVAQHPSENMQYLLTRVLAYSLNSQEGLEFSALGLADPDAPCLQVKDPGGAVRVWIEIGSPSARKIHRASKAAQKVKIYTYKRPEILMKEIESEDIFQKKSLEVYSFDPHFLDRVSTHIKKDNRWTMILNDGSLMLNSDDFTESCELVQHQ